jgi:hypothetical protein
MVKKVININNMMGGQFVLLIIFIVYIIFNVPTPEPIASLIDSTLGYVVIIALFALMAVNLNPIITLVGKIQSSNDFSLLTKNSMSFCETCTH